TTSAWLGNMHYHRRRFAMLSPVESFRTPSRNTDQGFHYLPADTIYDEMPDEDFRKYLRNFIENNYPDEFRYLSRRARWHEVHGFYKKLGECGMASPAW